MRLEEAEEKARIAKNLCIYGRAMAAMSAITALSPHLAAEGRDAWSSSSSAYQILKGIVWDIIDGAYEEGHGVGADFHTWTDQAGQASEAVLNAGPWLRRKVIAFTVRVNGDRYGSSILVDGEVVMVRLDLAHPGRAHIFSFDRSQYLEVAHCPEILARHSVRDSVGDRA